MFERLQQNPEEIIDRSRPVKIYYREQAIDTFEGDTVAAALMAAGVKAFGRSFKYHRSRGPNCLSGQCGRCAMTVDGIINVRTCQTPVRQGMKIEPQSPMKIDPMSAADKLSGLLPTGFYYKRFHKPAWIWPYASKMLRKSPGNLGRLRVGSKEKQFEQIFFSPELLVIGGGLAGLEAALVGAKAGIRVVLLESAPFLGGFERFQAESGGTKVRDLVEEVKKAENIIVLTSTTVAAIYPDGLTFCVQTYDDGTGRETVYQIDPRASVVATGALSRPMIFAHNDRPGIILPEAAQKLVHLHSLRPNGKVLLAGGDDYLAKVSLEMAAKGVKIAGLADYRKEQPESPLTDSLSKAGIPVFNGSVPVKAYGGKALESVDLYSLASSKKQNIRADYLVSSSGRDPRHKLLGMAGAKIQFLSQRNQHVPVSMPSGYFAAGRVLGAEDPEVIAVQGRLAGAEALAYLGLDTHTMASEAKEALAQMKTEKLVSIQPFVSTEPGKTFVCFCSDATEKDMESALAEGFDNVESAKRYTTATMGPCQGGSCHANFTRMLAAKQPDRFEDQPLTTPRPAVVPISLGALAAGHHLLTKRTPLHHIQEKHGAKMKRFGAWIRVDHFGDPEQEARAVHHGAGLIDVSTLGKFRLYGPDAEKLYNLVNTNNIHKLKENKILYTATCNEEGVIIDDGTAVMNNEHEYYITTSTARADQTPAWYGRWCRDRNWDVHLASITETLAAINLVGPKAREILAQLTDTDLSNASLPYMGWRMMDVAGVKGMVFRMGFMGELSYEIHYPASQAEYLWEKVYEAGASHGIQPIGVEALWICRLEKGHVLPGVDTDGNTTLLDCHLGWLWDRSKEEMVGGPMLRHMTDQKPKIKVVGFSMDGRVHLRDGYPVLQGHERWGHVTSVRYSEVLDKTIGLALVNPHPDFSDGGHLTLVGEGGRFEAPYHKPPFYDPKGERMKI